MMRELDSLDCVSRTLDPHSGIQGPGYALGRIVDTYTFTPPQYLARMKEKFHDVGMETYDKKVPIVIITAPPAQRTVLPSENPLEDEEVEVHNTYS